MPFLAPARMQRCSFDTAWTQAAIAAVSKADCLVMAQARTQAAIALACTGDIAYAVEWEAQQQKLPPPSLAPAVVNQWR